MIGGYFGSPVPIRPWSIAEVDKNEKCSAAIFGLCVYVNILRASVSWGLIYNNYYYLLLLLIPALCTCTRPDIVFKSQ